MKTALKGRVWKFGDNIDTDIIIPAIYLASTDPKVLGEHCMEPIAPDFSKKVLARLGEDSQNWVGNEKREGPAGRFHERLMNEPAMRELVQDLESAKEPQRRMEIAGKLRNAYLTAWRKEFGQPREGQPRREGPPGGKPERRDPPPPPPRENEKK